MGAQISDERSNGGYCVTTCYTTAQDTEVPYLDAVVQVPPLLPIQLSAKELPEKEADNGSTDVPGC